MFGGYVYAHGQDMTKEDSLVVAAIQTNLHMGEQATPEIKLKRITLVYDTISSPAGYRLMRNNPGLAKVVGQKTTQLIRDTLDIMEWRPDLTESCAELLVALRHAQSRCGAIMGRRYDFRPALKAPRRYYDEF